MARVSQSTQQISRAGLAPVMTAPTAAPSGGDIVDTGAVALMVTTTSGACNVTVQTPIQVDGLPLDDLVVAVAAGKTVLIGPFPTRTFGQPEGSADAGRAYVDYDTVTGVTRAVVKL